MPLEYDRFTECVVNVSGKQEVRRIACLRAGLAAAQVVPVLKHGERVTYAPSGAIWIYRALK